VSKRFSFLQALWYLICGDSGESCYVYFTSVTLAGRREGPQYWLSAYNSSVYQGYCEYKDGIRIRSIRPHENGHGAEYEVDGKWGDSGFEAADAFDALVAEAYTGFTPPKELTDFFRAPEEKAFLASPVRFPALGPYVPSPALLREFEEDPPGDPESSDGEDADGRAALYVRCEQTFDHYCQHDVVKLIFTTAPGDDEAADISFLLGRGGRPPYEGLIARAGEPLCLGDEGDAEDRWPGSGDWFWSWDALRDAAREAGMPKRPYGVYPKESDDEGVNTDSDA
jgi:hypothetical protein